MLYPHHKQHTPPKNSRPPTDSNQFRPNNQKTSLNHSPSQKKQNERDNILITACCPNCRYIFKVVDDNKLSSMKQRLITKYIGLSRSKLSPKQIKQQSSTRDERRSDNGGVCQLKRNETPKFWQKSPKKSKLGQESKSYGLRSPNRKNLYPKRPEYKKTNMSVAQGKAEKNVNGGLDNVAHYISEQEQQSEGQIDIQKDLEIMKKYLNKLSSGWTQLRPDSPTAEHEEVQNLNTSINKLPTKLIKIVDNECSTPKRQLEITRKCSHCSAGQVEIETVLSAAKSRLVETEINLMAHFVERETSTPSYIKSLQQCSQTL